MANYAEPIFSSSGFMPHGMCYLWQPGILTLHVTADALITLAYFSIPFTLLYFVRKRTDLQFNWMFVCFAVFIVACGTTHLMEIWTIWQPVYWLSGAVKAITALASVPTAILLVRLVPDALRVPSPATLQRANAELELEIAERKRAATEVRRINEELEARVRERTHDLEAINQSLRDSQQLLHTVVDNSEAVIYAKDLDGRYLLVNRRYGEIFRLDRNAVLGKTDFDIFSREAAEAFCAMDARVAAANDALTEEETAPQQDGPHTYISVKAPLRDAAGKMQGIFGVSTDITERKRAEERLRTQFEHLNLLDRITRAIGERQDLQSIFGTVLRSLEDNLPIDFGCICLHESQEPLLRVASIGNGSQSLAQALDLAIEARLDIDANGLWRCLRGKLVYEPDLELLRLPLAARFVRVGLRSAVVAPLLVEQRVFGLVFVARCKTGGFSSGECEFLRQLSEHVALAANQAQLYGALEAAYQDLRRTQQSVMQQERLRALGQMASGIAHDINNALSPAALYVQSLVEKDLSLSAGARDTLVIVERAIEDVARTVARMREFYRERDVQMASPVDINTIVQQVVELTRARWADMPQERGVVIHVKTELASPGPFVLGAENEIRDALTNLVLNAVDALPRGGTLTLRARTEATQPNSAPGDDSVEYVCVEVCDTGVGMSEETRSRCLEPFFTTKGERGTGLGLAMVYGMAQRHRAQVEIQSKVDVGTTVRLVFPAAPRGSQVMLAPASDRPLRELRILVVDDDAMLRKSLSDVLTTDGHSVTLADGGQAGIDTFLAATQRGEPFDLTITDLGMPHVDGRAVAAAIKNVRAATPVVMLTGWGQRLRDGGGLPPYVDRVLSKPPNLGELRSALAEVAARLP